MDLGLLTGCAAGGPAAPADSPAPVDTAAPHAGDASVLAGAFRSLIDALAGGIEGPAREAEQSANEGQPELPKKEKKDPADQLDAIDPSVMTWVFQTPAVPPTQSTPAPITNAPSSSVSDLVEISAPAGMRGRRPNGFPALTLTNNEKTPQADAPAPALSAEKVATAFLAEVAAATIAPGESRGQFDAANKTPAAIPMEFAETTPGSAFLAAVEAGGSNSDSSSENAGHQSNPRGLNLAAALDSTPIAMAASKALHSATVTAPIPAHLLAVPPAAATAIRLATLETPVQSPMPAEVAPQIVQAIRLAWSRNSGEAQIKLDPKQFGHVTVSLRVEDGGVVARVQAEQPAVREWLQTNQRVLQGALSERQLTLERLEVVKSEDGREPTDREGRDRESSQEARPRRARRGANGASFEVVA